MSGPTDDHDQDDSDEHAVAATAELRVEGWIRTMLSDSTLQPLYLVLLFHGVVFFAPVLLFAFRDRNLFGLAGIAILLTASGSVVHRDWQTYRRLGPLGGTLLAVWILSAGGAWAANRYGLL